MFWIILIFVLIIIGFLVITDIYASVIAAPFFATPKNYIRRAFQACNLKSGEKIYDLGSGDGRALIMAAKEFGANAKGFELSYLLYLISKANILFHHLPKRVEVKWCNFYNEDLRQADVIFCWLTPRAFPKLAQKFNQELKAGTRVIAFSSPLGFWQPEQEIEFPSQGLKLFGRYITKPSKVKLFFYSKK
ncbi:MAG: SAM-dependent methyltransferase [Patescibacteria group bacterium]